MTAIYFLFVFILILMFLAGSRTVTPFVYSNNLQKFTIFSDLFNRLITFSTIHRKGDKYEDIWNKDFDSFQKMPKSKELLSSEGSSSDAESSSEEEIPKPKKMKTSNKKEKKEEKAAPEKKKNSSSNKREEDEDEGWDLGNNRRVKITEFRGTTYVDIREMYLDKNSNELKPGFKGICLNPAQWRKLMDQVEEVDKAIKNK